MREIASHLEVSLASVHLWTATLRSPEHERATFASAPRTASARSGRESTPASRVSRGRPPPARQGNLSTMPAACSAGPKARRIGTVELANSDVNMDRFFVRFLSCSASTYLTTGLTLRLERLPWQWQCLDAIEAYWLDLSTCRPPGSASTRSTISRRRAVARANSCRTASAQSASAQHRASSSTSSERSQSYGGFDEPRWLDCRPAATSCSSISSSAFWAWRRFSAWSQTAERSP